MQAGKCEKSLNIRRGDLANVGKERHGMDFDESSLAGIATGKLGVEAPRSVAEEVRITTKADAGSSAVIVENGDHS